MKKLKQILFAAFMYAMALVFVYIAHWAFDDGSIFFGIVIASCSFMTICIAVFELFVWDARN